MKERRLETRLVTGGRGAKLSESGLVHSSNLMGRALLEVGIKGKLMVWLTVASKVKVGKVRRTLRSIARREQP